MHKAPNHHYLQLITHCFLIVVMSMGMLVISSHAVNAQIMLVNGGSTSGSGNGGYNLGSGTGGTGQAGSLAEIAFSEDYSTGFGLPYYEGTGGDNGAITTTQVITVVDPVTGEVTTSVIEVPVITGGTWCTGSVSVSPNKATFAIGEQVVVEGNAKFGGDYVVDSIEVKEKPKPMLTINDQKKGMIDATFTAPGTARFIVGFCSTYEDDEGNTKKDCMKDSCGASLTLTVFDPNPSPTPSPPPPTTAWFQLMGGHLFANGEVDDPIPASPSAGAVLIQKLNKYAGIVIDRGTNIFAPRLGQGKASDAPFEWQAYDPPALRVERPNGLYRYFRARLKPEKTGKKLFGPLQPIEQGNYYWQGYLTLVEPWTVTSGDTYVIFIDGQLTINAPISVEQGGFLAFIVSGDIIIDESLGDPPSLSVTPDIAGVFITDGAFDTGYTPDGDKQLVVAGIVRAKKTNLSRDLAGTDNDNYPAELFIYRPDLLFTMPRRMMDIKRLWQEVAP